MLSPLSVFPISDSTVRKSDAKKRRAQQPGGGAVQITPPSPPTSVSSPPPVSVPAGDTDSQSDTHSLNDASASR